ncbi:MAG TPA: isoprenylcysteine carboxylmethyltransferase family protein [Bacteroidales bacterium]|nr:isoprenylcysteine carboxylmethyltransferase family protein [Bacteroidales bacterium]
MNSYIVITGTFVIIIFSWFFSIKHGRYHGIARFFSFESIFLLFLLNYQVWFKDPFGIIHLASWFLLIISIYPVTAGFILLKKAGKPDNNFENTTVLVDSGIYAYIRHPLYLSLILLGTGIMLKDAAPIQLLLGLVNLAAIYTTAIIEEKEMITKFGDSYREYMRKTKMFIPHII